MQIDIAAIKDKIRPLAEKYHLKLVVLFGSEARNKTHPQSDVDFGFLADRRLSLKDIAKMQFDFSGILKIGNLEMHDLSNAPPLLLKNIATESILLYEGENSLFNRFKIYGIKIYMEARPLLKLREAALNKFLEETQL